MVPVAGPAFGIATKVVPGTRKRSFAQSAFARNENCWPASIVGSGTVGLTPLMTQAASAARDAGPKMLQMMAAWKSERAFINDLRLEQDLQTATAHEVDGAPVA